VAGICNSVGGGIFWHATAGADSQCWSVLIGNMWMSWLQDLPAVLECANCSLHVTVAGALCETGATVSLRTVPRLSLLSWQSCRLRRGSGHAGRAGGVSASTCVHAGSNDVAIRWLSLCGIARGSFQKTAPIKTAENTVKHLGSGVGSVVAMAVKVWWS